MPQLILASASPRRRELLQAAGVDFTVDPGDIPEIQTEEESASEFARRLARAKACTVAGRHREAFVLGADTVVALDGRTFGKPIDTAAACRMLAALSGATHQVVTAVAFVKPGGDVEELMVSTEVTFRSIREDEIGAYIATGEPFDKAGAYAIQGRAAEFVTHVAGSRSNVVGLPMAEVLDLLRRHSLVGISKSSREPR